MHIKEVLKILVFLIILSHFEVLSGQAESISELKNALVIEKLTQAVNFDGIPDEEAWNSIVPLKLIMHSPVFGKEPEEKTDTRIAYDDKYLYVAAYLFYENPELLRSASLKRDYMGAGGDWFGIILDTYNDKENALSFMTSPDALRWDATIQKDAVLSRSGDIPVNISWNTFWDVRTNKDQNGWSVEMRIPFSSLRFQEINGEVRMGLIVQRWIPARNETDLFPAIPPNWGQASAMKPSQAQEVVLRGVKPDKPIYIAPYMLTGYDSRSDLNENETEYFRTDKPILEAGLDVKYGLSNNMIMDLTLNTDFAQVEVDDQQVNLTRYSLYFPEKRMFFLERASVFDFSLGGNSNLFYSRRIGLSDDGDPIRIYGGSRISGRLGKWDMGILDMQTAPLWKKNSEGNTEKLLPSENFGVMRLRRQIINQNSFVGGIFTSRLGLDGSYNLAYGIDAIWRVFGNDYLDLKWAQSFEDSIKVSSIFDPAKIMATWERRSSKGFAYNFGYSRSGLNFNPGIGFEMIEDYSSYRATFKYGWLPEEKSKIYSHSPQIYIRNNRYVDDGSAMAISLAGSWELLTKKYWQGKLTLEYSGENLRDSLNIITDDDYIPPAKYEFYHLEGNLTSPTTKSVYVVLKTDIGQFFDGNRLSMTLEPLWNVSRHFELGAIYNYDNLNFRSRNMSLINHILGLKTTIMVDTRLSVNAYIQYNTAVNSILSNLRLRYNPKEGNDFYIVYTEGRNTQLTRELPNLPLYSGRTLLLKYNYTFNL